MSLPQSPSGRRYGARRDLIDKRDKVARSQLSAPLSTAHDESKWLGVVRDQGIEGSCVGHGWAGFADWLMFKYAMGSSSVAQDFSPAFFYYMCRKLEGTLPLDEGAQVRTGAKVFNQFGALLETEKPYGPSSMNVPPTMTNLQTALTRKGGAYHRLLNLNDMKACLASGYCFVDGIEVFNSFESDDVATSGDVPMPSRSEPSLGGHCTLTFGYDDEHVNAGGSKGALHKRNSWGSGWGQEGNFWIPYAYASLYITDAWILHLGKAW